MCLNKKMCLNYLFVKFARFIKSLSYIGNNLHVDTNTKVWPFLVAIKSDKVAQK